MRFSTLAAQIISLDCEINETDNHQTLCNLHRQRDALNELISHKAPSGPADVAVLLDALAGYVDFIRDEPASESEREAAFDNSEQIIASLIAYTHAQVMRAYRI